MVNRFKIHMTEENNGVEAEAVIAPAQQEVDYEALLAAKDAEIAKVQEEKDNYRKGLLKAKGKLPDSDQSDAGEDEDIDARIDRRVNERLLETREAQLTLEKDQALKAVLKRNRELETALKNRGQVSTTSADGSNQDRPEGKKDSYFSNDQLSALRAKGYDDRKIATLKENMSKVSQMPKV